MATSNKYFGSYSANHNSTFNHGYVFSSKNDAIKTMRIIAEGEAHYGLDCKWAVDDSEGNEIASGGKINGKRYRTI